MTILRGNNCFPKVKRTIDTVALTLLSTELLLSAAAVNSFCPVAHAQLLAEQQPGGARPLNQLAVHTDVELHTRTGLVIELPTGTVGRSLQSSVGVLFIISLWYVLLSYRIMVKNFSTDVIMKGKLLQA